MRSPLPTNIELLIFLANQSGYTYQQVYTVWAEHYRSPDSYLITETILGIAVRYRLPIQAALAIYKQGPQGEYVQSRLQ